MTLQEEDHENTIQTLCRERKLNRAVEVLFHSIPSPSHHTYISLLRACTNLKSLSHTHHVHAYYHLYSCNNRALYLLIGSYLIVALAKCGALSDAFHISHGLPSFHRSVFSWTSIISACVDHGHGHEALRMYGFMLEDGFQPNGFTYASLFKACGMIGDLSQGMRLHADAHVEGILSYEDLFVCNSLLSMYGKCGGLADAWTVFNRIIVGRDCIAWNAIIAAYAQNGDDQMALHLFKQMEKDAVKPDGVTYLNVLLVCSYTGSLEDAHGYFDSMVRDHAIEPNPRHYACMIDLLGRAGLVNKAIAMLDNVPSRLNSSFWHTILGACQKWVNVRLGKFAFEKAIQLDNTNMTAYICMANIYKASGMHECAKSIEIMRLNNIAPK